MCGGARKARVTVRARDCYTSAMSALHPARRFSWRWPLILAASVLAHLLAFGWAGGYLAPGAREKEPEPLRVTLLAPPPKAAEPPPKPRPAPKPRPKPGKQARPAPPQTPPQTPAAPTAESAVVAATPAPAAEPPAPAQQAATQSAWQEPGPEVPWSADPPPPAELEYTVTALREGSNWHGSGRFLWQTDGERYQISGEASVTILLRITVLNFRSEGRINQSGIAPDRYSETPWRKQTALTWFDRGAGKISFSASGASWPVEGGEQDRASIAWQLAALGRADGSRFTPGGELEIVVAGARSADRWRFRMVGLEEVETPHGRHLAWHLHREARGRRDQGIDIWLAPQLEWYPVRLRHNYANGEFLDMTLSALHGARPSPEQ